MAQNPLTERFVQNTVAERLNKEYYRRKPAYIDTEVYTRLKRADVFLAFMRARRRPYVVVVEAKSRTTIHQLKLKEAPHRVRWAGRLVTIVLIVGLSAALGYQWYFNAMNTLLLLSVFVLGSSLISALIGRLELTSLGAISAIEQLARYPANEKWIAVGEDTFVRPEEYERLKEQCKKNGLGLLVVTARGKMRRILIPFPRHTFNNYLNEYGKEKDILARIAERADYGPTPPERAKLWRQLLNGTAMLAVVGLLALLTYEDRVRPIVPDPFADSFPAEIPRRVEIDSSAEVVIPGSEDSSDPFSGADAGAGEVEKQGEAETPCSSLRVEHRAFIVVDAILSPAKADDRLAVLEAAGIPAMQHIPTDCLNSWPAPGRETIYTGTIYPDRPAAVAAARAYNALLREKGLDAPYGKAVKVR